LAVANSFFRDISILLGTGNGSFGAASSLPVGPNPAYIALSDFNGDGNLDIVTANSGDPSSSVSVLLGTGTGSFIVATNYAAEPSPRAVAISDYNSDGKLDLAVTSGISSGTYNYVIIFLGTGTGTFNSASSFLVGTSASFIVSGDFNNDSQTDLAMSCNDATVSEYVTVMLSTCARYRTTPFDFDGDGKSDIAVYRAGSTPNAPSYWHVLRSLDNSYLGVQFGAGEDAIVPEDFDGDGKTNFAVFRPSTGTWYTSLDPAINYGAFQWGQSGDIPIPGDFDGDGRADYAVFRPGNGVWYVRRSSDGNFLFQQFGANGDKPLLADFDGDGKTDFAYVRVSGNDLIWNIRQSSNAAVITQTFGLSTDKAVPADYDADGRANIAVFRPSTGKWYTSTNPATNYGEQQWGQNGDVAAPADYDGDGKTDLTVFRPSTTVWWTLKSTNAGVTGQQWGLASDLPVPAAYIPQ